ncbi:hypothetical protein [Streptomyces salinarius]|uniref:hypothetical protein n=1 Tax=Streptomyces salinarius TaxID=2762598 RepID=UPI0028528498|nr:hypothetical protein [Streptomyces salinarius]
MSCNDCCPPIIVGGGTPGPEGPAGPPGPVGPPGDGACVSVDPGNTLQFGTDGCLFVPGSEPVALVTGCGLLGDGTDGAPLAAGTSGTWGAGQLAFPCEDTQGGSVYCDSRGRLRAAPPQPVRGFSQFAQDTMDGPPEPTGTILPLHDVILTVTNPSTCRTMMVATRLNVNGVAFTQTAGNDWALDWSIAFSTDGSDPEQPAGPTSNLLRRRTPGDLPSPDAWEFPVIDAPLSAGVFGFVAPGQTIKARARLFLTFHATNLAAGADGTAPAWRVREAGLYTWGITQ